MTVLYNIRLFEQKCMLGVGEGGQKEISSSQRFIKFRFENSLAVDTSRLEDFIVTFVFYRSC
jgi:hypothetical protein